jgi:carbonic anhydrase/acetyltransferase-like protein (isoleucine patch superfamily)
MHIRVFYQGFLMLATFLLTWKLFCLSILFSSVLYNYSTYNWMKLIYMLYLEYKNTLQEVHMIIEYNGHKPDMDESCFVAENATVIGRVKMGENSSIWFGTVVRGDSSDIIIGENTNIQDNCTIHVNDGQPTLIGDNVTAGHGAIIHACTIGNNVLIGMGAIVLDGAEIGDNVIIGAGALVPPNKKIPSNSMVMGTPAKIVRELSEEDRKSIIETALHYVELAKEYR